MKVLSRPCGACPFRRGFQADLAVVDPASLIGQAVGPFVLPCHKDPAYAGKGSDCSAVAQCAGAAVFRANLGISGIMPAGVARAEPDRAAVFSTPEELLAHHAAIPLGRAAELLAAVTPTELMVQELRKFAAGEGHVYGCGSTGGDHAG